MEDTMLNRTLEDLLQEAGLPGKLEQLIERPIKFEGRAGSVSPDGGGSVSIIACICASVSYFKMKEASPQLTLRGNGGNLVHSFVWDFKDKVWRTEEGYWCGTIQCF